MKAKKEIIGLYIELENISKIEDNPTSTDGLDNIAEKFENFFIGNRESMNTDLFKTEILQFTIKNEDRPNRLHPDKENPINGDTLLLRAMSIPAEDGSKKKETLKKIKETIIKNCPRMVTEKKKGDGYEGLTPIHVAILKEELELLKCMMKKVFPLTDDKTIEKDSNEPICAEGSAFQNTVMMAGTLLGVASLKNNHKIFRLLLKHFPSHLNCTNEKGDNIVHSLIKYAHEQPDKRATALEMLNFILSGKNSGAKKKDVRELLMMENKEKLYPLQLAAKRQQYEFFKTIMDNEVYHSEESLDGLYNEEVFDITEIETLPIKTDVAVTKHEHVKTEYRESVLEYIVHHKTDDAFRFADFPPVKGVIKSKWSYYRWWFRGWFAIHLIYMTLLSVAAVYRSKLSDSVSENNQVKFEYLVGKNWFVTGVAGAGICFSVLLVVFELVRVCCFKRFQYKTSSCLYKRAKSHFYSPYSNWLFIMYFRLFHVLLFVDFIVAMIATFGSVPDYHNHCLIFAVIIGWYLVMFFLQGFKPFGFFTVLIQRVIVDMLKFAFVMFIFLVAFSTAMYMIMQGATTEDDDFKYFGKTMVKMLTIMLGIGELGILFQARQPILAIIVFVLYVLFTTILLLNALIAMMSNSCTDLMNSHGGRVATKMHCRLQKLSVVLFLESYLPRRLCKETELKKYENKYWTQRRRFWSLSTIPENLDKESEGSFVTNPDKKGKKRKTHRQSKIFFIQELNNTHESAMQQTKQKCLDITDIHRTTCKSCKRNELVQTQTQEITELVT